MSFSGELLEVIGNVFGVVGIERWLNRRRGGQQGTATLRERGSVDEAVEAIKDEGKRTIAADRVAGLEVEEWRIRRMELLYTTKRLTAILQLPDPLWQKRIPLPYLKMAENAWDKAEEFVAEKIPTLKPETRVILKRYEEWGKSKVQQEKEHADRVKQNSKYMIPFFTILILVTLGVVSQRWIELIIGLGGVGILTAIGSIVWIRYFRRSP